MSAIRKRVRLVVDDSLIPEDDPMKKSWFLISEDIQTIRDLCSAVLAKLGIAEKAKTGVLLQLEGFTLPPSNEVDILREGDTISVLPARSSALGEKRKRESLREEDGPAKAKQRAEPAAPASSSSSFSSSSSASLNGTALAPLSLQASLPATGQPARRAAAKPLPAKHVPPTKLKAPASFSSSDSDSDSDSSGYSSETEEEAEKPGALTHGHVHPPSQQQQQKAVAKHSQPFVPAAKPLPIPLVAQTKTTGVPPVISKPVPATSTTTPAKQATAAVVAAGKSPKTGTPSSSSSVSSSSPSASSSSAPATKLPVAAKPAVASTAGPTSQGTASKGKSPQGGATTTTAAGKGKAKNAPATATTTAPASVPASENAAYYSNTRKRDKGQKARLHVKFDEEGNAVTEDGSPAQESDQVAAPTRSPAARSPAATRLPPAPAAEPRTPAADEITPLTPLGRGRAHRSNQRFLHDGYDALQNRSVYVPANMGGGNNSRQRSGWDVVPPPQRDYNSFQLLTPPSTPLQIGDLIAFQVLELKDRTPQVVRKEARVIYYDSGAKTVSVRIEPGFLPPPPPPQEEGAEGAEPWDTEPAEEMQLLDVPSLGDLRLISHA